MPYRFENPDQKTFKALKFNGMLFAVGRGLFIHIMKYHPSLPEIMIKESRSQVDWSLENFSKATQKYKSHFKGIRFEYVDVDKSYRETLKAHSKFGEGWWKGRDNLEGPDEVELQMFVNFAMNYENGKNYFRRLGKGMNIPLDKRIQFQDGVDFTKAGYRDMLKAYREFTGSESVFHVQFLKTRLGVLTLSKLGAQSPFPELKVADWAVWRIRTKNDREEYLKNATR